MTNPHGQLNNGVADRGLGCVRVVGTLAVLMATVALGTACDRSRDAQPATGTPAQAPSTAPPPAKPTQPPAPPPITEATKVGASTDPAFQKPQVATDPSFAEARGQLLPDIADFPAYPNAKLIGSAVQNRVDQPPQGYRIKWTTSDSVPAVMAWYQKALPAAGWKLTPPADGAPAVEQLARISKDRLSGYVAAEASGEGTEIVVSLKKR
jgi:hypothetical protein